MIDWQLVKDTIHDWAMDESGYDTAKVVWDDETAPAEPYLVLKIASLVQVKGDYTGEADDNGFAQVSGDRELTLSLQAFGGDPFPLLEKMKNSLQKFETRLGLPEGLAFIDSKGILSVSELVGAVYEVKATLDLVFRLSSQFGADGTPQKPFTTDEVGIVETVVIEGKGTYVHPGGDPAGE